MCRRVEVREGRLVGTLFLPRGHDVDREATTGCRPPPCILTVHGGHNRRAVVEDCAALLCSRLRAPTLALAFFGVANLPRKVFGQDVDVTYFQEAIDYAEEVSGAKGVGLWGISKV